MPYCEFGTIKDFNTEKDYSDYEPEKYNCVSINDDYINEWWDKLVLIKTYFHCYNRPSLALARLGVTLIPPESLEAFYDIVCTSYNHNSLEDLLNLMRLIRKAIVEDKYIIHYGI